MNKGRSWRAKVNMVTSLGSQIVTIICGIIVPRIMIASFGSEVYGATTSITQFLSYVTLLEGGIGGVARAALYRPLAEKDREAIGNVYYGTKRFFTLIGCAFLVYTLVLAFGFHDIANTAVFDRSYTFLLVLAISLSSMAQYFGGITNMVLLNADQKQYVGSVTNIVTTIINTIMIVLLVTLKCDVLTVKLVSSLVFLLRPVIYTVYVRRHYQIVPPKKRDLSLLSQKWTGLGQHLAFFLHSNTDVALLTIFADLKDVSVYAVHNLVVTSVSKIATSFSAGMESLFGELIAKQEHEGLYRTYKKYETIISVVTIILFGTAAIMIVPFVRLYTKGFTDANYIEPQFAVILLMAEAINCLMIPCSTLPVSANHFRQTKWGAYGEAILNIVLSSILIQYSPLIGVAVGTLLSVAFRGLFYIQYSAKHILKTAVSDLLKVQIKNTAMLIFVIWLGNRLLCQVSMGNYLEWFFYGVLTFTAVSVFVLAVNMLLSNKEMKALFAMVWNRSNC